VQKERPFAEKNRTVAEMFGGMAVQAWGQQEYREKMPIASSRMKEQACWIIKERKKLIRDVSLVSPNSTTMQGGDDRIGGPRATTKPKSVLTRSAPQRP